MREHWRLAPDVTYLNHGSFGPSPWSVQQSRREWESKLEANPMSFLVRELPIALQQATQKLANFLNAPVENLVFSPNSTAGMNVVAQNVPLAAGDEVLLNDHEYGAVIRIWGQACQRANAKTVLARLPYPLTSAEEIVESIFQKVTERTKIIIVSHIASATSVTFPVEEICRRARQLGILVCVDGPHAVAMLPVDLRKLDCDFYTASCHKWLCGPFGTGFLYVRPRWKQGLKPTLTSWGRSLDGSPPSWKDEFQWPGTFDPSATLAVPSAIDFLKEYGLKNFREQTHQLAATARQILIDEIGAESFHPDSPDWYGSMISMVLPVPDDETTPGDRHPLQVELWQNHQIEIPIVRWKEKTLIRVSAHLYNHVDEIHKLVSALKPWLAKKNQAT